MKNFKKLSLSLLLTFTLISCNLPNNNVSNNSDSSIILNDKYTITGKAVFPEKFNTKATISEVGDRATVSLIYPYNDPTNPNVTIATGLTDNSGVFTLNTGFTPVTNKVYVLEASKRIGYATNAVMTVRTFMRHNGTSWQSITSPSIVISALTTGITIIDYHDNSITPDNTIGKVVSGVPSAIGSVTTTVINDLASKVTYLLTNDTDPTRFIGYANSKYYLLRENSFNKNYLISNKSCPNCDLSREDLSSQNLSSSDLTNADLTNANLTSANLSSVNLTGATITGADFSNATWTNGTTTCLTGSIGKCLFPDFLINTYTTSNQSLSSMAVDTNGNFIVTWQSYNQESGSSYDIYAQRYNSAGVAQGSEFRVNTYTTDIQGSPKIAVDTNGNFIIAWQSNNQSSGSSSYDIYAQRYNSSGVAQGSEFLVNTYTTSNQSRSSIATDSNGNFIVTWRSNNQSSGSSSYDIYAQRYNSSGVAQGSEFRVNTYTTNIQVNPSIAVDTNGNFIITWQSYTQASGSSSYDIYAQRYNSSGVAQGSEFRVNTYTTNIQANPLIAVDTNGNFIVTWHSNNQASGSSSYDIYAQRYNSSGVVQGSEFRVNTYTTNAQNRSSIATNSNGNFIITWTSTNQASGTSVNDIYAQRYNSSGVAQGSEFLVNTYTTSLQRFPSIAVDTNGNFIITWQSSNQASGSSSDDIYFHKYNSFGDLIK